MKKIYEMRCYGVSYYYEADSADEAKKKLSEYLSTKYSSPVPVSHIKVTHRFNSK